MPLAPSERGSPGPPTMEDWVPEAPRPATGRSFPERTSVAPSTDFGFDAQSPMLGGDRVRLGGTVTGYGLGQCTAEPRGAWL